MPEEKTKEQPVLPEKPETEEEVKYHYVLMPMKL